jgi:hypothetical protein
MSISPLVPFQIYDVVKKQRQSFSSGANASYTFNNSESAACAITESKDKSLLAITAARKVYIVNKATGTLVRELTLAAPLPSNSLPGSEPKISADNNELFVALRVAPWYQIFDLTTGADISSQLDPAYRPTARIAFFDYSPNGEVLAIGHTDSKGLAIYYVGPATPPGFDPYDFGDIQPPATGILPLDSCGKFSPNNVFFGLASSAPNALRIYDSFTWALNRTVQPEVGSAYSAIAISADSTNIVIGKNSAAGVNFYRTGPGVSDPVVSISPGNWAAGNGNVEFMQNDSVLVYAGSSSRLRFLDVPSGYAEVANVDAGVFGSDSVGSFVESFVSGNFNYHLALPFGGFREFRAQLGMIKQFFDWDANSNSGTSAAPVLAFSNDKSRVVHISKTVIDAVGTINHTSISSWNAITGERISRFTPTQTGSVDTGSTRHAGFKISPDNAHVVGRFIPDVSVGPQVRSLSNLSSVITNLTPFGGANALKQAEYSPDGQYLYTIWGPSGSLTTTHALAVYSVASSYALLNLKSYDVVNTEIVQLEVHPNGQEILVSLREATNSYFEVLEDPNTLTLKYSSKSNSLAIVGAALYYKGGSKILYRDAADNVRKEMDKDAPFNSQPVTLAGAFTYTGHAMQTDPLCRFFPEVSAAFNAVAFRDSTSLGNANIAQVINNEPGGVTNTNISAVIRQIRS